MSYTVGVEAFEPYFQQAKQADTHSELIPQKIQELKFDDGAFDAVVMIEVLEHLPEHEALEVLRLAEKWAQRKVIVTSPNGFVPQKAVDDNPLQVHLSGWDLSRMRRMGYVCHGLLGLKILRQEVSAGAMADDLLATVRFRPRLFWFFISALTQVVTYYVPRLAFGLLSVKPSKSVTR